MSDLELKQAGPHMDDLLAMAEAAGMAAMRDTYEAATIARREASATVTLFLAGAGGALAMAARTDTGVPMVVAALAVSLWLFALAAAVVLRCLGLEAYPAAYQEPQNLLNAPGALDQIRRAQLSLLQERLDEAKRINARRADALNVLRLVATFTPAVAALGAAAAWAVCR